MINLNGFTDTRKIRKFRYLKETKKKNSRIRQEYLNSIIRIDEVINSEELADNKNLIDSKLFCIMRIKEIDHCNFELDNIISQLIG